MFKTMKKNKHWIILAILFTFTVFGILVDYNNWKLFKHLYSAIDTSSAVALAFIAGYSYWEHAKKKQESQKFINQLAHTSTLNNKDALLGIQFGGTNKNVLEEMKQFALEHNIDDKLVLLKSFGDENNMITNDDVLELEDYLKEEVIPLFTNAEKVHLLLSGVGISYYVCGDIFSNWKPILVYHYDQGNYTPWYLDNKHRLKIDADLKHIDTEA